MSNPTINFPDTFWNASRLSEFWDYVKYFMAYNMPFFMIVLAVFVVGMVIHMVVDIPIQAKKEDERAHRRDDDDDYEVKYY